MLAYHNDPALKDKLLANLAAHAQADELIQGQYWEDGKGCAVACTLIDFDRKAAKEGSHERYEDNGRYAFLVQSSRALTCRWSGRASHSGF
jgi:hypothetical protein